jgi:hypothetical protein
LWCGPHPSVMSHFALVQLALDSEHKRLECALEQARALAGNRDDDDGDIFLHDAIIAVLFSRRTCACAGELEDRLRLSNSDLEGEIKIKNRNAVVVAISIISMEVSRAALADSKATIADVTKLRWEVEGRELEAHQQLAVAVAERDDLKSKLQQQQDDSVQVNFFRCMSKCCYI